MVEYVDDGPGRYLSIRSAPAQLLHDQLQTVGKKWDPRLACLGSQSLEAWGPVLGRQTPVQAANAELSGRRGVAEA